MSPSSRGLGHRVFISATGFDSPWGCSIKHVNKSKDINKPKSNIEPSCKPDIITEIPEGDNRPRSVAKTVEKFSTRTQKSYQDAYLFGKIKF